MSAVAEPLAVQLDEARYTARQRRGLEEAVIDASDRLKAQQTRIQGLMDGLADPDNHEVAEQLTAERLGLKKFAAELQNARVELDQFNAANPTAEELAGRERELARQVEVEKRTELRSLFAANLEKRLTLLSEQIKLEDQAEALRARAQREWPSSLGTTPANDKFSVAGAAVGIDMGLLSFIPVQANGAVVLSPGGNWNLRVVYAEFQRKAAAWLHHEKECK